MTNIANTVSFGLIKQINPEQNIKRGFEKITG